MQSFLIGINGGIKWDVQLEQGGMGVNSDADFRAYLNVCLHSPQIHIRGPLSLGHSDLSCKANCAYKCN